MNVAVDGDVPGWLLHQAAIYDNVDLMRSLLEGPERDNINSQDSSGRTPLYTAVTNNSLQCCRLLLDNGADPNLSCEVQLGGMTPLHSAASRNNLSIVKVLIENGADLRKRDASGKRAVELAETNRSMECLTVIREKMERDQVEKDLLQKEFTEACLLCDVDRARSVSISPGFTLQEVIGIVHGHRLDDLDLLYRACDQGSDAMCAFLLQHGAPIRINGKNGQNAFHVSCLLGHVGCARLLLQHNPDLLNTVTLETSFPIHLACLLGQVEVVKLLLEHLAQQQLIQAVELNHVSDSVSNMVNARDALGQTPLHIAVANNHIALVQFLLGNCVVVSDQRLLHGSESEAELSLLQVPTLDEAFVETRQTNDEATVHFPSQIKFCVEVDAEDLEGRSALHLAVIGDGKVSYNDIVSALLEHNADPNRAMKLSGAVPMNTLMEAVQRSDLALIDLLLIHGARDDQLRALKTAIMLQDDGSVACLVKHRIYPDVEFRIGQKRLAEFVAQENLSLDLDPHFLDSHAITVCWHGLGLQKVAHSWLQTSCTYQLTWRLPNCSTSLSSNPSFGVFFVTRIDISNNCLSILPSFLFSLPNLRILNASSNQIRAIAKACTSGTLQRNSSSAYLPVDFQLEEFDEDIETNCPLLEEINLQRNQLVILPVAVFKLPSLKRLNASDNLLCSLPFDMWLSRSLVELNLTNNRLEGLPYFPEKMLPDQTSQENLSCGSSPCFFDSKKKPSKFFHKQVLNSCGSGELSNNSSVDESLDFHGECTSVPTTYVNCWQERVQVELTANTVSAKNSSEQNSQLKELILSGNQLEDVPCGLPCLAPALEKLSLSNNKLTKIGEPGQYPGRLKSLDLSYNSIVDEFDSRRRSGAIDIRGSLSPILSFSPICYSPFHLKSFLPAMTLSASNPVLRRFSSSTPSSSSPSLSSLAQSLPSLCPHRHHRHFGRLKALKLNNNKLTRFVIRSDTTAAGADMRVGLSTDGSQRAIFSSEYPLSRVPSSSHMDKKQLKLEKCDPQQQQPKESLLIYPNLVLLDLSSNEIESLPGNISDLSQLAELKISSNKIKELPPEMGSMKKLWFLEFVGCPIEATLRSVLGERATRTMTVLSYLKSVREEAQPFNRMKLMFVGKQGIGKTSLLSQLRYQMGDKNKFTHWAQRMGHETKDKDLKGENISTVGVDIGTIELQRGNEKVVFSTWDFGGQREYYATHQYFLSKRSLYLVVWRVTDGQDGVSEILRWLINIQARAPNSPVIIVGTHRDTLRKNAPKSYLDELGELIERKYIQVADPDKLGLPRVMGHIEVSCKGGLMSRTYVSQLVDIIWKVANEEPQPGNPGSRLLHQLVPSSYLHLQDVVMRLAEERKQEHKDPVLYAGQYKHLVMLKMEEMFGDCFQDISELNQATQFLHENGILLHYEDISLRDIYFLDPQWLCDMLANVITIREVNGLIRSGLMMTDDLKLLFKGISFKSQDIKSYIVDLLQKFEVALLWNETSLIIPSLLPTDRDLTSNRLGHVGVTIPVQGFGKFVCDIRSSPSASPVCVGNGSVSCRKSLSETRIATQNQPVADVGTLKPAGKTGPNVVVKSVISPAISIVRLYVMSYFPSGFWPRLITRLLGDSRFSEILSSMYNLSNLPVTFEELIACSDLAPCWSCWQTGVQLKLFGLTVLQMKEVTDFSPGFFDYRSFNLVINPDDDMTWSPINMNEMSVLEILIPNETLEIKIAPPSLAGQPKHQQSFAVYPDSKTVALLLAKIVDCVDLLLEDWYPDIGIRFTQNTRGMYLITRLVPCIRCLLERSNLVMRMSNNDVWSVVGGRGFRRTSEVTVNVGDDDDSLARCLHDKNLATASSGERIGRVRSSAQLPGILGRDQLTNGVRSASCDRDFKRENKNQPQKTTKGKRVEFGFGTDEAEQPQVGGDFPSSSRDVHCFMVEQCLQIAQRKRIVFCPRHGNLGPFFVASNAGLVYLGHVAPDTVFLDIGNEFLVDSDSIVLKKFLGKGAFGAVYSGTIVRQQSGDVVAVALKMLQPINPPAGATYSQMQLYEIERSRWDKDPLKNCCEAYLNARKELSILLTLRHKHMVPLIGISVSPLCLVLSLAPLGALSLWLRDYANAGTKFPIYVIRQIGLQVSMALEYLHARRVIYRDLKSENVLVWSFPLPHASDGFHSVDVKIADYGVSRVISPFGTKGFAGTLAFMAPEIMQHGGDDTYTEKVDCFSFGMFLYELLLLQVPYDDSGGPAGSNINIKGHVLAGGRPTITSREVSLPSNVLDLMTLCWSPDPVDRPSASEIVVFMQSVEFSSLCNAIVLDEDQLEVVCCCSATRPLTSQDDHQDEFPCGYIVDGLEKSQCDVWISTTQSLTSSSGSLLVYTYEDQECVESKKVSFDFDSTIMCMCVTRSDVWCACTKGKVHVFRRSDYSHVLTFSSSNGPSKLVRCMTYGEIEDQVYVALATGEFVVYSDTKDVCALPKSDEYLGNGEPICSMASAPDIRSEIWCGQSRGRIQIWRFRVGASCVKTLLQAETCENDSDTSLLVPGSSDSDVLWSYSCPVICRWSIKGRCRTGQVDLTQLLVPYFDSGITSTICSFDAIGSYLCVGTSSGSLLILDAKTLDVVEVCRAHEQPVFSILPLSSPSCSRPKPPRPTQSGWPDSSKRLLFVSVGKGYRDLVRTVLSHYQKERNNLSCRVFLLTWSGDSLLDRGRANDTCKVNDTTVR